MLRTIATLVLSAATLHPQSAAPRFEVASIKPSTTDANSTSGIRTGHGRMEAGNVTVRRCIIGAYNLGPNQISGGPDWLDIDRFDIFAKSDPPVDDDAAIMHMLRTLLAERFHLVLHHDSRTMPGYALEVTRKGPKLEKAGDGESSTSTSGSNLSVSIDARYTDMDSFVRTLARNTHVPVVNKTGLQGNYNFHLFYAPENLSPGSTAVADGPSLFTALQEQLGLRLRAGKLRVDIVVIDHVEKPTPN